LKDNSFDCVYASHVLEHIKEDDRALSEIKRVLTPSGIAVLPVPIVSATTIEYPKAYEFGHVRSLGDDYFEKYEKFFTKVKTFSSNDFLENTKCSSTKTEWGGQHRNGPWLTLWKGKNTLI
jgi:ubiquinone/menaquinone biosynthesis C-methylase UbiE